MLLLVTSGGAFVSKFCVKCSSLVMKSYNDYQSNRKCCQGCFSQLLIDNSLIRKFEPPKANLFIFLLSDKSPLSSFYNLFKLIRNYDRTTLKSHQMFNRWTMEILVKVSVSRIHFRQSETNSLIRFESITNKRPAMASAKKPCSILGKHPHKPILYWNNMIERSINHS